MFKNYVLLKSAKQLHRIDITLWGAPDFISKFSNKHGYFI